MLELTEQSFNHALVDDVTVAHDRLEKLDTPGHRRELIRTVFTAIEGLHWRLKQDVFRHADWATQLTAHEQAAMREETYSVDDRGNIHSHPRFLPLTTSIRLIIKIVKRYEPDYVVDFNHKGWSNLGTAVKVRNRLVHPKVLADLAVTDDEIKSSISAFYWMLALAIEILTEISTHLKQATGNSKPIESK